MKARTRAMVACILEMIFSFGGELENVDGIIFDEFVCASPNYPKPFSLTFEPAPLAR